MLGRFSRRGAPASRTRDRGTDDVGGNGVRGCGAAMMSLCRGGTGGPVGRASLNMGALEPCGRCGFAERIACLGRAAAGSGAVPYELLAC